MRIQEIELSAVKFGDEAFRISEDLDLDVMKLSLQAIGLINPVLLLEGTSAPGHTIICGFRRLHGLRALGIARVAARLLRPDEAGTLEIFLRAVWDNLSHRQLSPLEVARILFTLKHLCGVENDILVKHFLPLLGLSPHGSVLSGYLDLHRLHPDLRRLLDAGHLTLASADRLAREAPEAQAGVGRILRKIRLSASLQREVLELIDDMAAVSGTTPAEIMHQPEILAIADDAGLSAFQRGEKIHALLYSRRNPRLSLAREMFLARKAELNLPGIVRLSPDPFFESPRLRVEFDVTCAQAFRDTVTALERACGTASLDRIFQI